MARHFPIGAAALACALLVAPPVFAAEPAPPDAAPPPADVSDAAHPPRELPQAFPAARTLDEASLGEIAGLADVSIFEQIANAQNTGTVTGNTINGNSTTGTISIDGRAFDNFNGLAVLSANTGNNVSINSAMNVNVSIQQ